MLLCGSSGPNCINAYLSFSNQALGWQIVATKIGMQRCAAATQWLNERISLARYAHVIILFL